MAERVVLESHSEVETQRIGARLAAVLQGGERIGLSGELGAGKTCLVRGLAQGLEIPPEMVRSPSFTLVVPYEGGRLPLYHIDLFRLRPEQVDLEELREYLYGAGVCAIEWCERLGDALQDFLEISLTFEGVETRRLVAAGHGVGYHRMLAALRDISQS